MRVAGCVICRQRPGTANGFLFLSLEDETGIANAIVEPDLFDAYRETLVTAPYLLVEGILQNQQGAISVKLKRGAVHSPHRLPLRMISVSCKVGRTLLRTKPRIS